MNCLPQNAAQRRYLLRLAVSMTFYILFLLLAKRILEHHHLAAALTWFVASLPSLPILALIAIVGFYLTEEPDEFERTVVIQCMLWAIGVTLAVDSVWGFLEIFAGATHLPSYLNFVIFWFAVGVATPIVRWRYR